LNCAVLGFLRKHACRASRREQKSVGSLPDPLTQPKAALASARIRVTGMIDARCMESTNSTALHKKSYHKPQPVSGKMAQLFF